MDKMLKSDYLITQHNKFLYTGYFSHILHLDIIKSESSKNPYIWW